MKKILAFVVMAAILICPVFAAGAPSADPAEAVVVAAEPASQVATNRHISVEVTVEATCVDKGLLTYTYDDGSTLTVETLPTGEHDYVATVTEATCTEDGAVVYTCSVCGDTYSEAIPAVGHVPGADAATCTEAVICTVCGEVLTPASGHNYEYQYDAVQNEDGSFASYGTWACTECGDVLDATEGNAVYFYGQDEAAAAGEASGEASSEEPAEEAAAGNANYDPDAHNWASIELVMVLVIVIVCAVLMLSFGKGSPKKKED